MNLLAVMDHIFEQMAKSLGEFKKHTIEGEFESEYRKMKQVCKDGEKLRLGFDVMYHKLMDIGNIRDRFKRIIEELSQSEVMDVYCEQYGYDYRSFVNYSRILSQLSDQELHEVSELSLPDDWYDN